MPTLDAFPCPNCATMLEPELLACTACGLRLVGPEAIRLWQVNQQLTALKAESNHLIQSLMGPPAASVTRSPYSVGPHPAGHPGAEDRPPRARLSGQQILLGLGALLLLSAASFFLLVVWFVVGLVGQALIMTALTAAAVVGSVLATRRRLPAAAETAAVIATGLLALDLAAAHWLDLAGLGAVDVYTYWAGAGLVGGALLLGFDRVVPRTGGSTAELRRVFVYRPAGTAMLAVAGWSAVYALDPDAVTLCGLALVLAAASGAGAYAAYRFDVWTPGRTGLRIPWSSLPLLLSAGISLIVHVVSGLGLGYDPASSPAERYGAFALLLVVPVAALLALIVVDTGRPTASLAKAADLLPVAAVGWLVPVIGIPLLDADRLVLVGVSVVLAGALTVAAGGRRVLPDRPWATAVEVVAWVAQPALYMLVLVLSEEGAATGRLMLDGVLDAGAAAWWVPVVPALAWAGPAVVAALRTRSVLWVVVAEAAGLATLFTSLRDQDAPVWWPVALVMVAGNLALAGLGARRGVEWRLVEVVALGFGFAWSVTGVLASASESSYQLAFVLVTIGVLALLYAATPGRLSFSYLGSLAVSAGLGVLMGEAEVTEIEAYTAPLVLLLAAIGRIQWSRNHALPTVLTMGPTLSVALVPSLLTAVGQGSALRLLLVASAGVVVLVAGLSGHWQAPVTVGALVLIVVAVTQGGPLMAYVPGWVILGVAGAVLLAIGVSWEQAVLAGRRAHTWYGALR